MQQKVTYGVVTLIIARGTGRTDLKAQVINRKAAQDVPNGAWGLWKSFSDNCAHVAQSSGLPFDPTTLMDADAAAVNAAYEMYLDLDKALLDLWGSAVKIADAPVDAATGPEPLPKDAAPNS
jgi:hypothetical protein